MSENYENADGGVVNYDVLTGMSDIKQPYRETGLPIEDLSFAEGNDNAKEDFYDADGDDYYDLDGDEFYDADGENDDYANAGGLARWRERRQEKHEARMAKKSAKTDIKKARAEKKIASGEAKKTKADAKVGLAEAQKLSAEAASKGTEADIAMANALAKGGDTKPGMSKGAIIGIVVGVVVLLGVVGFVMYKKSQANKLKLGK